jgi:uncharacterized protein (DUF4415 family)
VSKKSLPKTSQTELKRVRDLRDNEIRLSVEHPEADEAHIVRGFVRSGLQPQARQEAVSLRLDAEMLAWFRAQGPGWQARMNAVLNEFKEASVKRASRSTRKAAPRKRASI